MQCSKISNPSMKTKFNLVLHFCNQITKNKYKFMIEGWREIWIPSTFFRNVAV